VVRRIPIGDFPFGVEERGALQRVIDSGRISEHKEVRAFEREYADWLGVKHCIAVSSGTAAQPRDRILIPALTFIATANAIALCDLEPIFGDVEQLTFGLKPNGFRRPLYDAIMPVHLMGYPADLHGIKRSNPDTMILEDACEAHGTTYCGRKVGTFGLFSAFSFYIAHSRYIRIILCLQLLHCTLSPGWRDGLHLHE
jgi:dTDP-4-amino-4,6-dideoxygalactose transaminase